MPENQTNLAAPETEAEIPAAPSWGIANSMRGYNWHDHACAFFDAFPIPCSLSQDRFAAWARERDIEIPRGGRDEQHARNQVRYSIRNAATHPRMKESGRFAFTIESIGGEMLEVQRVEKAIPRGREIGKMVTRLYETKIRRLEHLLQSADWAQLPPYERLFAESIYDDLDSAKKRFLLDTDQVSQKFMRLENRLAKAVERGEIKPGNRHVEAFLAPPAEDANEE